MAEALDHLLLHLAQQRDELRDAREVVGPARPSEHRGPMRGQRIRLRRRVVIDDLSGDHTTEPLPHIPFVQPGGIGDLGAGGRRELGEGVEELGLMPDRQQDGHAGGIDGSDDALGERLSGVGRDR